MAVFGDHLICDNHLDQAAKVSVTPDRFYLVIGKMRYDFCSEYCFWAFVARERHLLGWLV